VLTEWVSYCPESFREQKFVLRENLLEAKYEFFPYHYFLYKPLLRAKVMSNTENDVACVCKREMCMHDINV
jgi:hypothetical protein